MLGNVPVVDRPFNTGFCVSLCIGENKLHTTNINPFWNNASSCCEVQSKGKLRIRSQGTDHGQREQSSKGYLRAGGNQVALEIATCSYDFALSMEVGPEKEGMWLQTYSSQGSCSWMSKKDHTLSSSLYFSRRCSKSGEDWQHILFYYAFCIVFFSLTK